MSPLRNTYLKDDEKNGRNAKEKEERGKIKRKRGLVKVNGT
jgi:hypothetical protein